MPRYLNHFEPELPAYAFRKSLFRNCPDTLEGGKGGGAPSPPDPYAVAGATTQTNQQSAAYNKALNLGNYSNPFGSQQSSISGYDPQTGAPIYQTNISANPQLQGLLSGLYGQVGNSGALNQNAISGLAGLQIQSNALNNQLAGLGGTLSSQAAQNAQQQGQDAAYKSQTQYLDPQFSQQQESLKASLANQGLTPGSEAYNNAMLNFNNQKQQAYSNAANQSIMTGSQIGTQNWQNQLAGLSAQAGLLGQMGNNLQNQAGYFGQQVGVGQLPYSNLQSIASMVPGYSGPAQSAAQPANIGQNIYSNYQGQMNQYNANQAGNNSFMGGLFGLGSAGILGLSLSDRRTKTAIKRIGKWANGLGVYTYRYLWEKPGTRHIGFMADEVRKVRPNAVVPHASGFDMINYQLAGA